MTIYTVMFSITISFFQFSTHISSLGVVSNFEARCVVKKIGHVFLFRDWVSAFNFIILVHNLLSITRAAIVYIHVGGNLGVHRQFSTKHIYLKK